MPFPTPLGSWVDVDISTADFHEHPSGTFWGQYDSGAIKPLLSKKPSFFIPGLVIPDWTSYYEFEFTFTTSSGNNASIDAYLSHDDDEWWDSPGGYANLNSSSSDETTMSVFVGPHIGQWEHAIDLGLEAVDFFINVGEVSGLRYRTTNVLDVYLMYGVVNVTYNATSLETTSPGTMVFTSVALPTLDGATPLTFEFDIDTAGEIEARSATGPEYADYEASSNILIAEPVAPVGGTATLVIEPGVSGYDAALTAGETTIMFFTSEGDAAEITEIRFMGGDGPPPIVGETITVSAGTGVLITPPDFTARILDPAQRRAPTALTVVASGGYPSSDVLFQYDGGGTTVARARTDSAGVLVATSVAVPADMDAGAHQLRVISSRAGAQRYVDLSFTLSNPPATGHVVGPDADPVEIEEAIQPDGHRHWVFQDLMPGGLGSYIFPHNPPGSQRPDYERTLTARKAAANDGQVHVSEGVGISYPWTITGTCFTQEEQEVLEAWADLNRRFYVIDDFGEAWTVAATGVAIKPRKRTDLQVVGEPASLTDWVGDYTFSMLVYVADPKDPV